jgi:predicted DNA-binding ribbon-helix-helix protein
MLRHMRTTVRLEAGLLEQAKREAERRGTTLTALIEQGLRLAIRRPRSIDSNARVKLPVSRARGGVIAGVDLNDSAALLERMDSIG